MNVYEVTYGEYDDYAVLTHFTNRAAAEALKTDLDALKQEPYWVGKYGRKKGHSTVEVTEVPVFESVTDYVQAIGHPL